MKKLSLRDNYSYNQSYKLDFQPSSIYITDGFSGFIVDGKKERGRCAKCVQQFCRQYQRSELYSEKFSTFPKNTSNRVCPVDAIRVGSDSCSTIDTQKCISCGLCLHRCPYSAIQIDFSKKKCWVNNENSHVIASTNQEESQKQIDSFNSLRREIHFSKITSIFANWLSIQLSSSTVKDISEIVVRNVLTNLGCKCNTNAPGNNHNRVEFFAESGKKIIIGESEITNSDTLSVTRRILDDLAVLSSRHKFPLKDIVPLAVINGLPNKRTDYYEVIEDIEKVLGIKVSTITYHLLFVLNIYNAKLSDAAISSFYITRSNDSLLKAMQKIIPEISSLDNTIYDINYTPIK